MKWAKVSVFSAVLLLTISVLTGCRRVNPNVQSWPHIEQTKRIVIGLDDSFVPMGFRQPNGKLAGYDIDLARAVFKEYNIKVDFQTIEWSMKETELKNQTIDLIWNGYSVNPQRAKQVRFSQPYLQNDQVLVVMTNQNIHSFAEMKGQTLGVQSGSSGATSLDAQPALLRNYIAKQQPILLDNFNEAFIDLKANRIQGLLIDSVYAQYYIAHQHNPKAFRVIKGAFKPEQFAVGMRKNDSELANKIDSVLNQLKNNGTINRLNEKWFGNSKK